MDKNTHSKEPPQDLAHDGSISCRLVMANSFSEDASCLPSDVTLAHHSQVQRQLTLRSFMGGISLKNFMGKGERPRFILPFERPQRGKAQLAHSWFSAVSQLHYSASVHCVPPTLGRDVSLTSDNLCPCVSPHPHPSLPRMGQQTF